MERVLAILPHRRQPLWVRYGVTLVLTLVGITIQAGVYYLSGVTEFFLLFPVIFASGMLFDHGAGVLATIVGGAFLFFVVPLGDLNAMVPFVLYLFIGLGTAIISEQLRKTVERLQDSHRETHTLLRELEHRTKNNMAIMSSLLHLQARSVKGQEAKLALKAASSRIRVMADLYEFLKPSASGRLVSMGQYLRELFNKLEEFQGKASLTLALDAEQIELPESLAIPIAIIANELVTNSLKHAFPGGRTGTVQVRLWKDSEIHLEVTDDGVGCADTVPGVGSDLLAGIVRQYRGTITKEDANPGCRVRVRFPIPEG